MAKSFLVLGLGRFGRSIALSLSENGHEVLAIDNSEDKVNAVADCVTHALQADITDENTYSRLGINNFDCVIVGVGDDTRASVLATMICREMGAKRLVAKASDELHAKLLKKTGADRIIMPEHDAGMRLARQLISDNVIDYLDLSDEYSIKEIRIPLPWVNKSILELDVRRKYHVSIIALRRNAEIVLTLDPSTPFASGDVLIIVGNNRDLSKLEAMRS